MPQVKPTFRRLLLVSRCVSGFRLLRGFLKRVTPGMICRQEGAKMLESEGIILLDRYSLRLSLAFQTTSNPGPPGPGYFPGETRPDREVGTTTAFSGLPAPEQRGCGATVLERIVGLSGPQSGRFGGDRSG